MPFTIGTEITNLPSAMDGRFVTEQSTLAAVGGNTIDTYTLQRNDQGNSAIAQAGTWVVGTDPDSTTGVASSSDPTTWVGDTFIVNNDLAFTNIGVANIGDINTISIPGTNGTIVLTVENGGAVNTSDFGFEITAAVGNALSATEYPAIFSHGSDLVITFGVIVEQTQPTLADEKEIVFIEASNLNQQGFIGVAANTDVTISGNFPDAPADAFVEYGDKGADTNMGADSSILLSQDTSSFSSTNRTFRLSGGFDLNRADLFELRGTTVLHNTNTARNAYIRARRSSSNYNAAGGIDDLVLDGDIFGWGIYWALSLTDLHIPRSLSLRRGVVVGHAGSISSGTPGYYLVPNVDGTGNLNAYPGRPLQKYDVAITGTTTNPDIPGDERNWSDWSTAQQESVRNRGRFFELRNSADGLGLGLVPRAGLQDFSAYGGANITSEFTYRVLDEDGAAIPSATIYIPSATGGSNNGVVNFSALVSSQYTSDIPASVRFLNDATLTVTTDANGYGTNATWASPDQTGSTNPVIIGHIGYYQGDTSASVSDNLDNTANFPRLGNTPTATISSYGYHPLQATVDLRGLNVKEYSDTLALDEGLTSATEAAANAIMTYAIATRTATAVTASTLDNLHDALYVSRLVTSRTGNIARTWSVSGQTIDTDGSLTFTGLALSVGGTFNTITQGTTSGTLTLPSSSTIDFGVNYTTIGWESVIPETLISNGRVAGAMSLATNGSYKITGGEITNLTVPTATTGVTIEIPDDVAGRDAFITANSHVTVTTPPVISTIAFPGVVGNYIIRNNGATLASGTTNNDGATLVDISSTQYTAVDNVTLYWTGESYTDVVQPFTGMDFTIIPNRDVNVAEGDFAGTITAVFANDVATYTGTTSATAFSGTATNLWWNRAKSFLAYTQATVEYREFADSNTDPLISLTADNRTSVNGDFIKFVTGAPTQQVMTNVTNSGTANITEEVDLNAFQIAFRTADAYTSAQAQSDYATAGLSTDNSTRAIIDEELDAGKLTRVGRPS